MNKNKPLYSLDRHPHFFIGEKPEYICFADGTIVPVKTWRQAAQCILQDCNADPICHENLLKLRDSGIMSGRQRYFLCSDPARMDSPLQIGDSLYFEGYFGTEMLLTILCRTLKYAGYDYSGIRFQLRERELGPSL